MADPISSEVTPEQSVMVKFSGEALTGGTMDLADLVPALASLQRTIVLADRDLNHGATTPRVLITADTRAGSYEFVLLLVQMAIDSGAHAGLFHLASTTLKAIFGENGLIALVKKIGGKSDREVSQTTLDNGSVQFNIPGSGNTINNTIINMIVSPETAELYNRKEIRSSIWPTVAQTKKPGVNGVSFKTLGDSVAVSSEEADAFRPIDTPDLIDEDDFNITTEIVSIIKPSFDVNKRWRVAIGEREFGALMQDSKFLAKVQRREYLSIKGAIS